MALSSTCCLPLKRKQQLKACSYLSLLIFSTQSNVVMAGTTFKKELERSFATAVILTDSDVFTFGFHDFDPNEWFNLEQDNIGTEDSISLRKQITASTLPYTFEFGDKQDKNRQEITVRLSALKTEQDVSFESTVTSDLHKEVVLTGYFDIANISKLDEYWSVKSKLGNHLSYYNSQFDYRGNTLEPYRDQIDGVYVNTYAWAYIIEPSITLQYEKPSPWGRWKFSSSWHYFNGIGWGEANYGDVGNPEGWYMSNEAKLFYDVTRWGESVSSTYASFRRVDLGGDTSHPFGTHYYYETSIGWLITPWFKSSLVDNIGVGLTINYGSTLRGGSLVLFFNQD
ncbi:Solitary outer membrane autotransporter beta-barrel domain [Vibrio makurazakiensis]|uniref:Solitary outer membrane autotransporter beta-barrel domain n=1 Tax=Vibrio makurazakiensis TaxID=2910250 RepID=UPI003D0D7123